MSKKIQSTPLTFIDQTDSRKLEVYIKSNLPTVQIRNSNSGAYTPDWREGEKLTLTTDVFLDSRVMNAAEYSQTLIKWYRDEVSDAKEITTNRNLRTLQIVTNELATTPIITYICEATYQGIVASMRLTFARVDTGLDGQKGDDGTSVKILGAAKARKEVEGTNYWKITYDDGVVAAAELGDAYVYQGELYVCSVMNDGEDYFVNVGPIQGTPGDPAKNIVLIGSAQVFKVGTDGETIIPRSITVTAHTVNIDDKKGIKWQYKYDTASTWTDIAGDIKDASGKTIISINDNNDVATVNVQYLNNYTSIALRASYDNAMDVLTLYKVFDGEKGNPGDDAPIAFLSNEHISFVADANGNVGNQTVYTSVVGYRGTQRVKPTIGDLSIANAALELIGMKVEIDQEATDKTDDATGEVVLKISVDSEVDGKPNNLGSALSNNGNFSILVDSPAVVALQLNWTKVNAGPEGEAGVGIDHIDVDYGSSKTSTVKMEDIEWSDAIPVVPEGEYLWTRTTINYTDSKKQDTVTYTYVQQGKKGDTGTFVDDVDIQYAAGSNATTPPSSGWSTVVVETTTDKQYLWTKTIFKLSDGTAGEPVYSVAKQGQDGKDGTGASLVDVTPSAMYFKSTTGSTGPFDPQYIYLYPRFQNVTYSNWQYSRDGGTTWASASGANGITIGAYNSVANSLRIDRSSTLYTNTITSISFRCNSTNTSVYDTVSIAKIYDVADLQIGGRNYLLNSANEQFAPGTSLAEFLRTTFDLAPFFDEKGLIETTLSFDGYSPIAGPIQVYFQNGSDTRYSFSSMVNFTTEWSRYSVTFTPSLLNTNVKEAYLAFYGDYGTGKIPHIRNVKLEIGNTPSDWSPAPEDLIEEAANVNVMLSNEAHFFEATAGGVPIDTSVTLDVVGYKGSVKSATTVGTISGIPSAGMTATVTNNGTTNTKLTIAITSALTSDIADYGILTIPITVNGHTINKIFNWTKAKAGDVGASGSDAVTFQVYSNNGYALSTSVPTLTLQTFAYVGDVEIKAGATYQWYRHNNTSWVAVSGATNDYFNVSRDDVTFSNNYMCKMLFSGAEYVGVVTIEDKNDENKVFASKPYNYFAGDLWIVGTDYVPSGYTVGTMLRAEHTNTAYTDGDWVPATKYDDEIKGLKDTVDSYKQYFSVNSANGLQIGNSSINNDVLTTGRVEVATVNADAANIEALNVIGRYSGSTMLQAPVINLGKFSIVIESNGSLSVVANT